MRTLCLHSRSMRLRVAAGDRIRAAVDGYVAGKAKPRARRNRRLTMDIYGVTSL